MTTTVLIVDDQPLQRLAFRTLLDAHAETTVLGEAEHGAEAVRMAAALSPDVILMDIRMPGMDGIEATRRILAAGSRSRILVLTTFDLDEYAYSALRAGAGGFLLKDARPEELLAAIRAVARGDAVVDPAMTRRLIDAHVPRGPEKPTDSAMHAKIAALSEREREVLLEVAHGLTNTRIAEKLTVSESTVKSHLGRVLAKLGARDRVHLVIIAYETGLIDR